jgi:hypothetical protein
MDIADAWRTLRTNPADAPRAGAHLETAGQGITTTITQECVVALPRASYSPDLVTITVTSLRPGVAGHVTVGANLNSPDGSYQGPTTTVGHGEFTATSSQVVVHFVVLPWTGFPVLGFDAQVDWADGAPQSITLDYVLLECNPWVWWWWPSRFIDLLTRTFARNG